MVHVAAATVTQHDKALLCVRYVAEVPFVSVLLTQRVCVCVPMCVQNSPLEVDDEGFVIRADSTQNDILFLLTLESANTFFVFVFFKIVFLTFFLFGEIEQTFTEALLPSTETYS